MHWNQNIIFIIIAAIIGISRLVSRISEESKNNPALRAFNLRSVRHRSREFHSPLATRPKKPTKERVREFLEALGQPAGAAPPPKALPRAQIPPRTLAPVQPPASMRPFAKPVFRTWKEQAKEIVVLQQPAKAAPPEIRRIVVRHLVPAEANEPGVRGLNKRKLLRGQRCLSREQMISRASRIGRHNLGNKLCVPRKRRAQRLFCGKFLGRHAVFQSSNFVFETL